MEQRETTHNRGLTTRTVIQEAKSKVPVIDLADVLVGPCGMRRVGAEWVGRCPLPDHEDRVPSFTVNPEKNVWFCHGCVRGGDVVELARLAWGYDHRGAHAAAAYLLMEFGHEVPQRPPAWFERQKRQAWIRERIDAERVEHVRMLLFRLVWMPWLRRLPEWIREEATESAWKESRPIALRIYEGRRGA